MRVMFGQDGIADMFLRDPLDGRGKRAQVVDMARISQNRIRQRESLCAALLVGLVEQRGD